MRKIIRWLATFLFVIAMPATALPDDPSTPNGLQFRLEEGKKQEEKPRPPVQTVPLSEQRIQEILKRFPALPASKPPLVLPQEPITLPRTGKTIPQPFPANLGPTASISPFAGSPRRPGGETSQPLAILRFQPQGDVPLAPNLSVTFSEPMVPVTSQEKLAATRPPIQFSPQPEGQWYWLGARTLFFEPKGRFPMATEYTATIPAGAKAANGQILPQGQTWKFRTPAPSLQASFPGGTRQTLDPIIFLRFDQKVKPEAILARLQLRSGLKNWPLRLATPTEIEADSFTHGLTQGLKAGYWVAFKATEKFSKNTEFIVTLPPGAYSQEGPRSTEKAISFKFRTYGVFQFSGLGCNYGQPPCSPDSLKATFSNPLDATAFKPNQIQVSPEVKNFQPIISGDSVYFQGNFETSTSYQFRFAAGLKDQFGQTLSSEKVTSVRTGLFPTQLSFGNYQDVFILDPQAPKQLSVYSRSNSTLRVQLRKVTPQDWGAFQGSRYSQNKAFPGRQVFDQKIAVSKAYTLQEIPLNLTSALNDQGFGQVLVIVEAGEGKETQRIVAWVQSTHIGLGGYSDGQNVLVWATNLADGKPLSGVNLKLENTSGITDGNGIAQLPISSSSPFLIASHGQDTALLFGNWYQQSRYDSLQWYVFDDRKLYRPGETVHFKGWVRRLNLKESSLTLSTNRQIHYVINIRGSKLTEGNLTTNSFGGFDLTFDLPKVVNLGEATLELQATSGETLDHSSFTHGFRIEEFRRPEFSVSASAPPGPFLVGQSAELSAEASYYSGGGLAKASVTWQVTATQTNYTPPNWDKFTFGTWFPWWRTFDSFGGQTSTQNFNSTTDGSGKHSLRMRFDRTKPSRPTRIQANATVQDVNRQAMTGATSFLVHPASLYVGLRSEKTFVQKGDVFTIESIVTDIEGKVVPNQKVSVTFVRMDWVQEAGQWKQVEKDQQSCAIQSTGEAISCKFTPSEGGTYQVKATVNDDKGRTNATELTLWVPGGATPPNRSVEREEVTLIPDRKLYQPGQTAEVLVQSPFPGAKGLLIQDRNGIVSRTSFSLDGSSATLRIPVAEKDYPNINLRVELVGESLRTDDKGQLDKTLPKRPAFASGTLKLAVPPLARTLSVTAKPEQSAVLPGSTTAIDLEVKDASGKPLANSEVAVVVVDESVLDLADYRLADPLAIFYPEHTETLSSNDLREQLMLQANLGEGNDALSRNEVSGVRQRAFAESAMPAPASAPGRSLKEAAADNSPIALRSNFDPLAIFAPSVTTDSQGHARVTVKMPDNLTRYRVMAVAVSGSNFYGKGESTLTARLPLMIRPSAPRFLNFGDRFELPVVVQNQTDAPIEVEVALRGTGFLLTKSGQRVTVPANDRVEVRFPAEANQSGEARFQVAGLSGIYQDAAEIALPVQIPATSEAFATYGQIDEGAIVQPIQAPDKVLKQVGGLEISTSSTGLQALTDAYLYIAKYPYGCVEQVSSRVMATAALRDILSAFKV
ncbi:MAG: Ig-like domain-containing protein, partial [Anaerolineae bacterium]|nr:Ig-like domain-containing protein [Gloeobacterales cyanobacterium ES-bin-313]